MSAAGVSDTASHFAAVSDPDTPLSRRAAAGEFAWHVSGQPDVGGRYSALSAFGLLPAALMGVDLESLERPASAMAEANAAEVGRRQPGCLAWWDHGQTGYRGPKPRYPHHVFGTGAVWLWVEQMLAESTGKDGKGLVPIASEPMMGELANTAPTANSCICGLGGARKHVDRLSSPPSSRPPVNPWSV